LPLPFVFPIRKNKYFRILYLIKLIRIGKGFQIFNVNNLMQGIGALIQARLRHRILLDQTIAECTDCDNNSINMIMNIGYILKIVKLVLVIFNFSYFTGILWLILCDVMKETFEIRHEDAKFEYNHDDFITGFQLDEQSDRTNALVAMYFLFTSLSTVGFGDFYPKSDAERVLGAFMLLIGVSVFSYSMSIFITILDGYKNMNDDLDDGDNLAKFFGMMARFNNGKKIDIRVKKKIEAFFEYKWKYDKNQAIDDEDEKAILHQIPYEV
jgi:hypothetical protein